MPDETVKETTCPDTQSEEEGLFDDAVDDAPVAADEEQNATGETEQERQSPEDAESSGDADGKASSHQEDAAGAVNPNAVGETDAVDELKVVVSIREGRATIGVQRPLSDPHIESFEDYDLPGLTQEVSAVVQRAKGRWEESPKHPTYARPAPAVIRRNRRRRSAARETTADVETDNGQQQTLRLF